MCHRVVVDEDDYEDQYQYVHKLGDEIIDAGDASKDQIFSLMYRSLESHGIVTLIKNEIVNARSKSPKYDLTSGPLRIEERSTDYCYHFLLVVKLPNTEKITWEIDSYP